MEKIDLISGSKNHYGRMFLVMAFAFSLTVLAMPSQNAEATHCATADAIFLGQPGDNSWSNPQNWASNSLPSSSEDICIGTIIDGADAVLDVNFNLANGGQIEIPTDSSLTIPAGVTLKLESGSAFANRGLLINNGVLENFASFQNNNGQFDNFGMFKNNGYTINSQNGEINNYNQIENAPGSFGFAQITNQATLTNFCPSSAIENTDLPFVDIINNPDGTFIGTDMVKSKPIRIADPNNPGTMILNCQSPTPVQPNVIFGGSNGDGVISFGPTIGVNPLSGEQVVRFGFGIDGNLVDVKKWHTEYGWSQEPGTHTFTMKVLSDLGTEAITGVQLFTADLGSWDANNPIWKVALDRKMNAENWNLVVIDENNLIGDVSFTIFEVEEKYLLVSITISDMEPTGENVAIGTRFLDDLGGMNTSWFNDGLLIQDTYAYPNAIENFEEQITSPKVCTEKEDPKNRYSCAFEQKKIVELSKAQESFVKATGSKKISNIESTSDNLSIQDIGTKYTVDENSLSQKMDSVEQQNVSNESANYLVGTPIENDESIYHNFDALKSTKIYQDFSKLKTIYFNFDALKQ